MTSVCSMLSNIYIYSIIYIYITCRPPRVVATPLKITEMVHRMSFTQ